MAVEAGPMGGRLARSRTVNRARIIGRQRIRAARRGADTRADGGQDSGALGCTLRSTLGREPSGEAVLHAEFLPRVGLGVDWAGAVFADTRALFLVKQFAVGKLYRTAAGPVGGVATPGRAERAAGVVFEAGGEGATATQAAARRPAAANVSLEPAGQS